MSVTILCDDISWVSLGKVLNTRNLERHTPFPREIKQQPKKKDWEECGGQLNKTKDYTEEIEIYWFRSSFKRMKENLKGPVRWLSHSLPSLMA